MLLDSVVVVQKHLMCKGKYMWRNATSIMQRVGQCKV